jgi:hypothetical protein
MEKGASEYSIPCHPVRSERNTEVKFQSHHAIRPSDAAASYTGEAAALPVLVLCQGQEFEVGE